MLQQPWPTVSKVVLSHYLYYSIYSIEYLLYSRNNTDITWNYSIFRYYSVYTRYLYGNYRNNRDNGLNRHDIPNIREYSRISPDIPNICANNRKTWLFPQNGVLMSQMLLLTVICVYSGYSRMFIDVRNTVPKDQVVDNGSSVC